MTLERQLILAKYHYVDGDVPFHVVRKMAKLCDKLEHALRHANNNYHGHPDGQKMIDEALEAFDKMAL